jgi:hypothetical protein
MPRAELHVIRDALELARSRDVVAEFLARA